MKAFPFSMDGAAKDSLYLQPALFNTWGDMKRTLLEKFFPASRTAAIRKEICGIRQHNGETLHEYWERFNKLCATCPHHQISKQLLIQYFYEGLYMMDRSMMDAASGGALMDKTPKHLISNMASNTQQFGIRGPNQSQTVNEIGAASNQRLENQLTELTSLVKQLAVSQHQPAMAAKLCGTCTSMEHFTDMCPTLQETESTTRTVYSPESRIHAKCTSRTSRLPAAKSIISSTTFPTATAAKSAYSRQLSTSRRLDEANCNKQPGVPTVRELQQRAILVEHDHHHSRPQNANRTASQHCEPTTVGRLEQPSLSNYSKSEGKCQCSNAQKWKRTISTYTRIVAKPRPETVVPLSFPSQTISTRKLESDEELLKMFQKVEINIPLLDTIKQIPNYAKFLKELCIHKRRNMKGRKEIGGVVSALTRSEEFTTGTSRGLPKKCQDPRIFFVPCTIGECTFADAMLDLGASINVMPTSIYRSLSFGDLDPTGMTIQLANRSIVQPLGVLKDVLVQVNELIFPVDFYVLDMEDETSRKESTLILGRPFHMTARTKIEVHAETLSMEFGDTLMQFNLFEAMKHPTEDHSPFGIDVIEELVEEYFQLSNSSEDMEAFVGDNDTINCLKVGYKEAQDSPSSEDNHDDIVDLPFEEKLTELLDQVCNQRHSEYTNHAEVEGPNTSSRPDGSDSTNRRIFISTTTHRTETIAESLILPIIIANSLRQEQEDKLLEVLRQHKTAIGWKLSDLLGINPSICMHRILMEEEVKPIRKQQIRLNSTIRSRRKSQNSLLQASSIPSRIANG
ncbi:hypothetical protein CR513_58415, partial [Mucuna pruriens]